MILFTINTDLTFFTRLFHHLILWTEVQRSFKLVLNLGFIHLDRLLSGAPDSRIITSLKQSAASLLVKLSLVIIL